MPVRRTYHPAIASSNPPAAKFKKGDIVVTSRGELGRVEAVIADARFRVRAWDASRGTWADRARVLGGEALRVADAETASRLPAAAVAGTVVTSVAAGDVVTLIDGRKAYISATSEPLLGVIGDHGLFVGEAVNIHRGQIVSREHWPPGTIVSFDDGRAGRLLSHRMVERPDHKSEAVELTVRVWRPGRDEYDEPYRTTVARVPEPDQAPRVPTFETAERHGLARAVAGKPSTRPSGPPASFWRGVVSLFRAPAAPAPLVAAARPIVAAPGAPVAAAVAPMPRGELAGGFDRVAYGKPLRRYQAMALDAFEQARAEGRRRTYLVMPPGSGKTVVGLEIARRLGNRALALGPNTAIQAQWLAQWQDFAPQSVPAGDSVLLDTPVTALTYQAICNLEAHSAQLDDVALQAWQATRSVGSDADAVPGSVHDRDDLAHFRTRARKLVAQAGDHEQLLALLHPNGRALVERIRDSGQWTIVLDECHHLLEMWGYLVRAIVQELGERVFLVGLTATPPSEMEADEAQLYQELFGRADFEVPTPAVVKEGNLAPYQELAYLTTPLAHELDYIGGEQLRFQELVTQLMDPRFGTVSFLDWLRRRVVERSTREGVQVDWARFESENAALAQAAVRFYFTDKMALPPGARLREPYRQAPTADDWVAMIDDYAMGCLRHSDAAADLAAWESIHKALPSLGYALTRAGVRPYVSPVDRVLLLSAGKATAALDILGAEAAVLGPRLRALMLCDFEVAGTELVSELRGVLDPQAGSAALLLQVLVRDGAGAALDPILVTGKTVACSKATAVALVPWLEGRLPELKGKLGAGNLAEGGWEDVVEVRPSAASWETSAYVPLITRFFEDGGSRCLVGTRGLLGEGWDAKSVNVLIDLTGVTTSTSVHQMRGRSLRLDPSLPRKVAHNWDVVCVAPEHPKGVADYGRFVRKHRAYYSITAQGEIESGVSHVDAGLSPYGPPAAPAFPELNATMLQRAGDREEVYDRWGVGQPYRNAPTQTVRVHFGRSPGLPAERLLRATEALPAPHAGRVLGAGVLGGVALVAGGLATGLDAPGLLLGVGAAVGGAYWSGRRLLTHLAAVGPSGALEDMASAVAEAMAATGELGAGLGAGALRVVPQADGFYRCYLDGASLSESQAFADALDEVLAPIEDPRYIVPRCIPNLPRTSLSALWLAIRQGGGAAAGNVVYHAVPSLLANNQERAAAFGQAWNRYVSAGDPLFNQTPEAQAIIQLQRGEDPFDVTTQMRTLWH